MTNEQFVFWLKGFLEGKDSLVWNDLEKVNKKLSAVYTQVPISYSGITLTPQTIYPSYPTDCINKND